MQEFIVTDAADQRWTAILGGRRCTIRLRYNTVVDRWFMDLSIDDAPILQGRKIVLDVDLLAPFDLGVGALFASANGADIEPGRSELPGGIVRLYHATAEELAAAAG